jgi:hypothetical protein
VMAKSAPTRATNSPGDIVVEDGRPPNDCTIIAAQAYAKLKPATYWCQVIGVVLTAAGDKPLSHAMVFYKYQTDGNVFVYDERGGIELDTTAQDLDAIAVALQAKLYPNGKVTLKSLTH